MTREVEALIDEWPDPQGRLRGTGKSMRHLSYGSMDEVDVQTVADLVRRAAALQKA
jgi:hypothetical protein